MSAAITALGARSSVDEGRYAAVLAAAASLGIVLSWALLQVGFANMYELLDATGSEADRISFPGNGRSATMD